MSHKKGVSLCSITILVGLMIGSVFFGVATVWAADGSGTNVASPTSTDVSSTGNIFTFTFTAAETMDSGGISITSPTGWSTANGTAGTQGYTTVSTTGAIADIVNALDSTTNWTATQHMALTTSTDVNASSSPASSNSLANAITATAAANEQWYFDYGAATTWGNTVSANNLRVGMWLKSNVNTASGDFSWQDDNSAALASPLDTVAIPALTANTWAYTSVALGATSRTSQLSYGFRYTNDIGAATLNADSLSVIFQDNDSTTGWAADTNITVSSLTTAGNFKEGTGSVRCTYAAAAGTGANGECYDSEGAAVVVGAGTTVSFWVRSSVALNAGDFAWLDDNSATVASPDDVISLPALAANTWTYVTLTAPNSADMRSFGLRQVVDKGAMTIDIDAVGKEIDNADSTTGWTAPTASVQTLAANSSVFHENGVSLANTIAAAAATGDKWYEVFGSTQNWSSYTTVGFWIRSTVATTAGQLKFEYATTTDLSSPIGSLNIGALSANTWTYQTLTLSGTRTAIKTYGIHYATDIGAATVYLDDVLIGPGSPTFPGGGVVNMRILTLPTSGTITALYGDGGGVNGVTAPSTASTDTATTTARSSDSGTLTAIASQPTLTARNPVPTITTISPTSTTAGGSSFTLTVNGTNFVSGSIVRWNGSNRTTLFASSTQMTATITAADVATAGTSTVTVFNPTPGGGTSNSVDFVVYNPIPYLNSIVPSTAIAGALGATSTVTGANFVNGTVINWNGSSRTTTYASSTQVSVLFTTTDFSVATTSAITAFNPTPGGGNSTTSLSFTVLNPSPTTVSISPTSTFVGDATTTITITGTGFNAQSIARYNGSSRTTTLVSATSVQMTLPSSDLETATESALITVFNPTPGGGTSNAQTFSVRYRVPTLTSISPTSTDAGSGTTTITLTGSNFYTASVAKFDGASLATSYISSTTLTATIPASSLTTAGTSTVVVFTPTPGGGTSTAQTFLINNPVPSVFSTSPSEAFVNDPATGITVTGLAFTPSTVIRFDGNGLVTTFVNGTTATATIPAAYLTAAGTSTITAFNPTPGGGTSTTSAAFLVKNRVPVITALSPDNAEEGSATTSLTISGSYFATNVSVTFNGTPLTISTSSSSTINTSIPASLLATFGTSTVAVTNLAPGGGTATSSFIITRAAVRFVILDPADGTVDNPITVTVVAQKENGATSTNYQSDVTLNTSGSAMGGGLINIINGVGTTTISDTVAETVTLSLTDSQSTGLDVSSTQQVVFAHGATAKFTLTGPTTLDAGNRAAFTATRRDQYNNPATAGPNTTAYFYTTSTSTSAKFYDAATGGSIVTSALISSGTSTATVWYYDEEPGTYTITVSDNATSSDGNVGIDDATSTITVRAVATRFVIINPSDGTVDAPIAVTVQAQDNLGHIDTNYQSDVTLLASSTGGQATTTNNGLVNIINGVGTINVSDTVAETVYLSLSDTQGTGLNVASSTQDMVFAPGAIARFALTAGSSFPQDTRLQLTVFRKDQYGNNVSTSSTTAYFYANPTTTENNFFNASTGGTQTNVVTIGNGFASSTIWYGGSPLAALGTYTITASDNATSSDGTAGIDDATTTVTVTPVATRLVILDPADGTVDAPITVITEARDDNNAVVTSYGGSATLAVTGNAVLAGGGTITFTNGRATTTVTDTVAPETVTISIVASSTTLGATSTQNVFIGVGALSQFTLTDPGNAAAGTLVEYTATRKDQYGNLITSGSVSPSLLVSPTTTPGVFYAANSTSSLQISTLTFSSGESAKQFWYYNETAGTYQLTVQSGSVVGNDSIVINPAAIAKFTMNDRVTTNPGGRLQYTVVRKDAFNNLVTSGAQTVYMYANPTTADTAFYDAASGGTTVTSRTINNTQSSTDVWYYETQTGTYTITASDNATAPDGAAGLLDATDSVSVQVATATRFVFASVVPQSLAAGNASVVTIEARDDFGNLDTNYQSDVTLVTGVSSVTGSGLVSGQALINIVNGIGTITLTDNIAEVVNLALSDSQSTGLNVSAVSSITWTPGPTSQFVVNDPGDIVAGNRIGYTASRKDQYGNYVTAGSDTIYLYSDSLSSNKAFHTSSTTTSTAQFVTITAGATSTQFWYYDDTAGTYTITASDNVTTPDGTTNIDDGTDQLIVSAAPIVATRYMILDPQDVAVGQSTVITIQTQNNAGALDNTQQEDIYLMFSTSSISAVGMSNNEVLVSITDGVGTVIVTDTVVETVSLSLRRIGGSTSTLAITSTQNVAFSAAAPVAAGGGVYSYVPPQPVVIFTGRAYPGAKIMLFARTTAGDIPLERDIEVRADGTFTIDFAGALRGLEAFGLSILDANGRVAQTKIYAMNKVTAVTAEKNLYIAPTAGVVQRTVTIGNNVGIAGSAAPGSMIKAEVDGKPVEAEVKVGKDGTYRLLINTKDLAYGGHVVRTKQIDKNGIESDYSPLKVFTVSRALVTRADLNNNGGVDIGDWSIFLTRFASTDTDIRKQVDLNDDGKVDISDFSIFIRSTVGR